MIHTKGNILFGIRKLSVTILMLSIVTISLVSIHPANAPFTYVSTLEVVNPPGQPALAPIAMYYSPSGEFTAEIVSCGLGYPENFTASVAGKIALIQRGVLTFQMKTLNAAAAGAVAVIIYNNIAGNLIGTLSVATPIPSVGITQAEGQQLLNLLALGPLTVHLTVELRPTVYVDPATVSTNPTRTFTVNVNIQNVTDLFSYEVKLGFNKTILLPTAVNEGPFIKDQTTSPDGTIFGVFIESDFVLAYCTTIGNYPGVNGGGILFNVTFSVLDVGMSDLTVYDVTLLDHDLAMMAFGTANGAVDVHGMGDVNGDGKVDGKDITIVAQAFGAYPGHPRWNPDADLNGDAKINGKDIFLVAKNFGKTYP